MNGIRITSAFDENVLCEGIYHMREVTDESN